MSSRSDGPRGCATWVALRRDGSAYSDATGATYAQLRADPDVIALRLERGEQKVVATIPAGASPFFLRRANVTTNVDDSNVEWGSCVGWERPDGSLVVSWLLLDGSVITTDTLDVLD